MNLRATITLLTALSTLGLSGIASATSNVWDSTTPWGSAATEQYAAWNNFTSPTFNAIPQFGSGATLAETTGTALLASSLNIYNPGGVSNFTATLPGTSGLFDIYLRAATSGRLLETSATLNGVAATSVETFAFTSTRGSEQEVFWKWSNFSGAANYEFKFNAADTSLSLDQLALATVSAVPEAEAYVMMMAGLGLLGFMSRKLSKELAATA